MTVRGELAEWVAQLADRPAGLRVVDNPRVVDPVPALMVQVARTAVTNPSVAEAGGSARAGEWVHELDLLLVTGALEPAVSEDPLDAALDWLLEALEGHSWLLWTTAHRIDYDGGRGNAYRIPVTLKSTLTKGN